MRTIAGIVLVLGNGVPKLEAIENDLTVTTRIVVVMMVTAGFNHDFLQYMLCRSIIRIASLMPCFAR